MVTQTIIVKGCVVGKGQPRMDTRSNRMYKPRKTQDAMNTVAAAYVAQLGRTKPCAGPVSVTVLAYKPLPKSRPKKVVSEPFTVKPDSDNISKLVLDALTGLAYIDDAQVTALCIRKMDRTRNDEEHLVITIERDDDE